MKEKRDLFQPLAFLIMIVLSLPIILGYLWLFISTFSERTYGLKPVDIDGNFGGLTLKNWSFISEPDIWLVTMNTFLLSLLMTLGVLIVSSMAGYALSRIKFRGRKTFLSLTLILHAFPSITLLIAIYFVLRFFSKIPILGLFMGYNTLGGVVLVSLALQLPLGIWLMKGFFDNVSWDIERAALIDGCSRWRTFWNIMVPQIKPGLAALSIFSFMTGWSSFLIPYTFLTSGNRAVISTYLNSMMNSDSVSIQYGVLAAVGLFQLIPILFFYTFTQKYLMKIFSGGSHGGV
ncbi:MAG: carbohydrate ABC transporter permease [Spirochaetales bacterium]|nr:carbohydrate ABC transporter permease [Spirochaetales bacterium]